MRILLPSVLLALSMAAVACGSSDSAAPGSSGTPGAGTSAAASTADCEQACSSKATGCGASADEAKQGCATLCGSSPTRDQVSCLSAKSCGELKATSGLDQLCPKASAPAATTQGTPTADTTKAAGTCNGATCDASKQFCSMTKTTDAAGNESEWTATKCLDRPTACAAKSGAELCTCMKASTYCPNSGIISTDCSESNGSLSFGCMHL